MRQGLAAAYVLSVFVEWFHWVAFITLIWLLPSSDSEPAPGGITWLSCLASRGRVSWRPLMACAEGHCHGSERWYGWR